MQEDGISVDWGGVKEEKRLTIEEGRQNGSRSEKMEQSTSKKQRSYGQ